MVVVVYPLFVPSVVRYSHAPGALNWLIIRSADRGIVFLMLTNQWSHYINTRIVLKQAQLNNHSICPITVFRYFDSVGLRGNTRTLLLWGTLTNYLWFCGFTSESRPFFEQLWGGMGITVRMGDNSEIVGLSVMRQFIQWLCQSPCNWPNVKFRWNGKRVSTLKYKHTISMTVVQAQL